MFHRKYIKSIHPSRMEASVVEYSVRGDGDRGDWRESHSNLDRSHPQEDEDGDELFSS